MTTKSKKSFKPLSDILVRHYKNRNKKKHRNIHPKTPKGKSNFTSGRARSKEWNDSTALDLQKEIKNLSEQKSKDPNTFDRFAMK